MCRMKTSLVRSVVAAIVVLLPCSIGVSAEQMPDAEIAQTTVASAGLSWQPAIAYESAVLTVSGPGDVDLRREFSADEALLFLVNDGNEAMLEDGEYTWEIRFSPVLDEEAKKALLAARETGDPIDIDRIVDWPCQDLCSFQPTTVSPGRNQPFSPLPLIWLLNCRAGEGSSGLSGVRAANNSSTSSYCNGALGL